MKGKFLCWKILSNIYGEKEERTNEFLFVILRNKAEKIEKFVVFIVFVQVKIGSFSLGKNR